MQTANGSPLHPAALIGSIMTRPMVLLLRLCLALSRIALFFGWLAACWLAAIGGVAVFSLARREKRLVFGAWLLHVFLRGERWLFGVEITAVGELPQPQAEPGGSFNHRSYLDAVALGGIFPTFFLAKAEVARWRYSAPAPRPWACCSSAGAT